MSGRRTGPLELWAARRRAARHAADPPTCDELATAIAHAAGFAWGRVLPLQIELVDATGAPLRPSPIVPLTTWSESMPETPLTLDALEEAVASADDRTRTAARDRKVHGAPDLIHSMRYVPRETLHLIENAP